MNKAPFGFVPASACDSLIVASEPAAQTPRARRFPRRQCGLNGAEDRVNAAPHGTPDAERFRYLSVVTGLVKGQFGGAKQMSAGGRFRYDVIATIDFDRCVVSYRDGSNEHCFAASQRYAKLVMARSHPAIKDVSIERVGSQRFIVTLFVARLIPVDDVVARVRHVESEWRPNHVQIEYRLSPW